MKFLLAQINPVVGDLEGNAKKILNIASKASSISADFVLTPELSLWGYPANDLLLKNNLIKDIFYWKNFDKITDEVSFLVILREGYPVESNTLKMLQTYKVKFEISTIKIPNISSSKFRSNFNYSNLPTSLIDIVKKDNLYESTKLVE